VDVFFVISGYLIIGHITATLRSGSFSLADFWARRALRILPPFVLVLAASTAIGSAVLVTPAEINDFGASVLYAAAMIANQFFYDQQGYFDRASDLKPLLHTWTLSVEEQFYVVVPLLACGAAWIEKASKWRGILFAVAIILFLTSLFGCIEYTSSSRNAAFFLMPFRAWEFIAGGMIPVLIPFARRLPALLADLVAALGGIAILVAIVAFSERLLYPSYLAVLPVMGTVLLIAVGLARPQTTLTRTLSIWPFRLIGLVSYSWYLWHWPLLSFSRIYHFGQRQLGADLLAGAISFVMAGLTYLWIERPIREGRPRSGRPLWFTGSLAAVLLGIVGCAAFAVTPIATQHSQSEWIRSGLPDPIKVYWTHDDVCSMTYVPITRIDPQCLNQPWIKSFGFLMGDSHAMTAFPTLKEEARKRGIQLITRVDGSCRPLVQTYVSYKGEPLSSCMEGIREAIEVLKKELPGKISFVILKAWWPDMVRFPISRDPPILGAPDDMLSVLVDRLRLTIETFRDMGVQRILIVGPEPKFRSFIPDCVFRADHYGKSREICSVTRRNIETLERPTISALFKAAKGYDYVRVIDAVASLCDDILCLGYDGNDALYSDRAHMSHAGERKLFASHQSDFEWAFTGSDREE
jgi:peptidoglycan/LPS O-acetylase OafA/YrhL